MSLTATVPALRIMAEVLRGQAVDVATAHSLIDELRDHCLDGL
ncbi:hypothetical protein HZU77_015900 [Neisseriaceae bacterium TC5R-5]|nr:hypothetical protein [Neisseriaceae bacterium TC5R-5]